MLSGLDCFAGRKLDRVFHSLQTLAEEREDYNGKDEPIRTVPRK